MQPDLAIVRAISRYAGIDTIIAIASEQAPDHAGERWTDQWRHVERRIGDVTQSPQRCLATRRDAGSRIDQRSVEIEQDGAPCRTHSDA